MEYSEMIRSGLARSGRSQRSVAQELGLTPSNLTKIKQGEAMLSEERLRALAALLSLDGDELVIAAGACAKPGTPRARIAELVEENRNLRARLRALEGKPCGH